MSRTLRGLILLAMAVAVVVYTQLPMTAADNTGNSRSHGVRNTTPTQANFTPRDLEYYLNDDGIAYIRPGMKVANVTITNAAPGSKPVVEFYLTDDFDQPLDRLGKVTPGVASTSFLLAAWNPTTRYYTAYTMRLRNGVNNPSADQGGTWTDLEVGHYKYTFGTAIPANHDVTKTLTLGIYGSRNLTTQIGKTYYMDNYFKDFRTDGAAVTATWGAMSSVAATCNKCHNPLGLHGGTRRDPKNCMICHQTQISSDATSGETFNGKVFFHKLHYAANLPSGKPYIAGGDWSGMTYPQDMRNCTTCHDTAAKEKDIWMTRPSRVVCGSCHDDINWTTGENHPAGAAVDDSQCATCHQPESEVEFDASVKGAHVIPTKSKQLKGLTAEIVSASNVGPDKLATIVFKFKDNSGAAVDGSKLNNLRPIIGGPTTSYTWYVRDANNPSLAKFDAATGNTTYTMVTKIPATATGSVVITGDFYRTVTIKRGDGGADISVREAAMNPMYYASLSSAPVVPRRTTTQVALCNDCHANLGLHGGSRQRVDECVVCHNPTAGDGQTPKESISMQRMVHRIHTGEELTQHFQIASVVYNEVLYPGDRRDCIQCHTSTGYQIPVASGDPVTTATDYFSPQGPGTAACLGCHDSEDAAAHAYLNTTTFPGATKPSEACAACHSTGKEWGVDKVHAR